MQTITRSGNCQIGLLALQQLNDIDCLLNERRQLQQFVSRFKDCNDKYLKIKDVAEEHVNRLLTEQESLLGLALKAVVEALRMNPDRYAIIYDSKYNNNDNVFDNTMGTTASGAISSSSPYTSSNSIMSYQNHYYNEYHEGILEIAS
jgi:hypothetical protein